MRKFAPSEDGFIHSEAIEINAVLGCNLSCRACSHTSPVLAPRAAVDPQSVGRDLTLLARCYRADHVRILGGEPLLHPDLAGLIDAIRASRITKRVRVVTNGLLLRRQGPRFWDALDEVYVSAYPGYKPEVGEVELWRSLASRHGVEVRIRHIDHFRESYSEIGTDDQELVRRIYSSCLVAHVWRCHNVVDGIFYKCPQSHFLALTGGEASRDGVEITDDDALQARLLSYLNDERPLRSCRHCLGAVGRRFAHEQVRRNQWRLPQQRPTEELVDYEFLHTLEHEDPAANNSCITKVEVLRP